MYIREFFQFPVYCIYLAHQKPAVAQLSVKDRRIIYKNISYIIYYVSYKHILHIHIFFVKNEITGLYETSLKLLRSFVYNLAAIRVNQHDQMRTDVKSVGKYN